MSHKVSKTLVEKALPFLKCWKDVQSFKISAEADSGVVLFSGSSANLDANTVSSLGGSGIVLADSKNGGKTVSQKFTMKWVQSENALEKEIEFNGLTGGLKDQSGRPGVKFNSSDNSIAVNLLLCRSEGSFAIHSTNEEKFFMVVAPSNEQNGPDHEKVSVVPFNDGVKLQGGWWHSVPFPHPEGKTLELEEFVVENVENEVVELSKEVGNTLKLNL